MYKSKCKNKNKKSKEIKDNKGNWEFNFFQKYYNPNEEAKIKIQMKQDNDFNPKNIYKYIEIQISKEEVILNKQLNGILLKQSDKIILNNYINKKKEIIKNDINAIVIYGLSAKPNSNEGKLRLLLQTLNYQIEKNNKELIANIYLKLMEPEFIINNEIKEEYKEPLNIMNNIILELDLIKLQFTLFHSQMPPLNIKGFKKLDEWQIKVINNIDNNISTIVNAPTSAGKSILSGYVITKGNALFIVPTDALAWQMSAYIGNILNTNVPILTETYKTNPNRNSLIEILNNSHAIVGTAETIIDYLPFINIKFKWLILDEFHMIGRNEGCGMEKIIKVLKDVSVLALSATIGNSTDLIEWLHLNLENKIIDNIICNKRFYNLQKYYYDNNSNELIYFHPLASINESDIINKSILNKNLQPTPPDIWDFAIKLKEHFDLKELDPYIYFLSDKRIELDQVNDYFNKLLVFIINNYDENILKIIYSYKYEHVDNYNVNLINLTFKLKETKKCPVIIFQENTLSCLRIATQYSKDLNNLENETHPKLMQDRLKLQKTASKLTKNKSSDDNEKQTNKQKKNMLAEEEPIIINTSLQEPHLDFIMNDIQYFSEIQIDEWAISLKQYFPNCGDYYHFIIKLLWRGVGIYVKGLPDPYLRLVQTLACNKQLAVVFSDKSLVFGISMPFRSVVILRDTITEDNLDAMLFHQMSGRAGRRGLDKEGHIIFAGYSWKRMQELSGSNIPNIYGNNDNNILYTIPHANTLSIMYNSNQNWTNSCNNLLNHDDITEYIIDINSNYKNSWNFAYDEDINYLHMNWKLRTNNNCIIISYLIPYLKKYFDNKDATSINNQIEIAHFLCYFLNKETIDNNYILSIPEVLNISPYNQIINNLKELDIIIPQYIDNKIFLSIQGNNLISLNLSEIEINNLREELMIFSKYLINIQHYCFHSKFKGITKLLAKLLTRIWWIYHNSSFINKN
jgi:superfamily II RNA helicase